MKLGKVAQYIYENIRQAFKKYGNSVLVLTPVPSPISKIKNQYRWRILVKCKFNNNIINSINNILCNYYKTKYKAKVIFDVNPTNMM